MRILGWALLWAVIGLVTGYAATLGIGLVLYDLFQVSQREGAAAMALAFIFAPMGACVAAIVAGVSAATVVRARERRCDEGTMAPPQPWGRGARAAIGGTIGFIAGYGAAVVILSAFYQLRGSPYFDSYAWALAAGWLPFILGAAGAAGGARLALRNRPIPPV